MSIKLKTILDQILKEAATPKIFSKQEVKDYINNNRSAKYYKIAVTKDSLQVSRDYKKAIEVVDSSPIDQFELDTYGDTISFSAPYDEAHGALVGDFKTKGLKQEDFKRFDFQNTTGGGGRRFIPNQGIIPQSMLNGKDFMLSNDGTKLYMDPLLVNAIVNSKTLTNRAAKVRYMEFKEKMGPHFQQFKKGLEGRLSKVVKSGKPFEVWNGTIMTNKKGQIIFPYSDIGTIAENEK